MTIAAQQRALLIGNSMSASNDLPRTLSGLASAGGDSLYVFMHWGGQTFQQQLQNPGTMNIIRNTQWDFVVLQENSGISGCYPGWSQGYFEYYSYNYARELNDSIKNIHKCAQTVFFMLWGYSAGDTVNFPGDDYESHQSRMRRNYLLLSEDFNAITSPVGMAWKRVRTEKPWLNMYAQDGYHPNMFGSYLAACVFYATFYNKSPYGLNYNAGLQDTTARYLQQVAAETVLDSLSTWNIGEIIPIASPKLVYPIDNADQVPISSTFTWNKVNKASGYTFELATNANFSPVLNTYSLNDTSFVLQLSDYGIKHYWRVTSNYNSTSFTQICSRPPSEPFSFTSAFVGPKLTLPVDSAECIQLKDVKFFWEKLGNFSRYVFHISRYPDFRDTVDFRNNINGTTYTTSLPDQLINYYWHVQAYEGAITKKWSQTYVFKGSIKAPIHVSPKDFERNVSIFNLVWESIPEAEKYLVQISLDSTFLQIYKEYDNITAASQLVELPDYQTVYHWRLAAFHNGCRGPWSNSSRFTTSLKIPRLIYPADKSENNPLNISFQWIDEPNAEKYEIQIASDSEFEEMFFGKVGIPVNSISVPGFQQLTTYYWKIRYVSLGDNSPWSAVYSFKTGIKGLEPPILSLPAYGAVKVPLEVEFEWIAAEDALSYDIQVSKDSEFNEIVAQNDEPVTEIYWSHEFVENYTEFFWRVRTKNLATESQWSQVWTFRTTAVIPDGKPELVAPANNAINITRNPVLKWNSVERAETYRLVVEEFNENGNIVIVDRSDIQGTEFEVNNLNETTIHYWQVWGINEAGEGPASDMFQFTTEIGQSVVDPVSMSDCVVFPNPADDSFTFTLPDNTKNVRILDITGREIYNNTSFEAENREIQLRIDVSSFAKGVYMIYTVTNDKTIVRKLIVQ